MSDIFLNLFNMSITASWLVLAVVVFRFAFKKAPKSLHVVMWGLVGLRLICPFSFESVLSLIPSAEPVPPELVYSHSSVDVSGAEILEYVGNNPVWYELGVENGSLTFGEICAPDGDVVNPLLVITYIASIVWIIGVAIMLIYGMISYALLYRKVHISILHKENIYFCDNVDTPFILGVIKPKIYLPSGMSAEQAEYVIKHEKAHLKRKDHWWKPLGFALLAVYWFNPIIWLAYVLLCRDIEHACDEKVIRDMDNSHKKGYLETLVNCSSLRRKIMICPLAFGEVSVKGRIKSMLNYKKPAFWVMAVAVVTCIAVAVCFLTNPIKDAKEESTTKPTTQDEESSSAPTTTEPASSEEASTEDAAEEDEKTEEAENATEKAGEDEPITENPDKPNITNVNKGPNGKTTYTTNDKIILHINNNPIFSPQDSYIAVKSPELNTDSYFNRSVVNAYKVPEYYDSSVQDASYLNKAVELQKEFYWINTKRNELGVVIGTMTYFKPTGMTWEEEQIYGDLVWYESYENKIMLALIDNGTLEIDDNERDELIRAHCYAHSYIHFEYPVELSQELVDKEIAFIRDAFGEDGVNNEVELQKLSDIIYDERVPYLESQLPSYEKIDYSVDYCADSTYTRWENGIDKSEYNKIKESHKDASNGRRSFFIEINYDPVDHVNLDEASQEKLNIDVVTPDYIAYKKRDIDKYTVTLNKEKYISAVKKYQ